MHSWTRSSSTDLSDGRWIVTYEGGGGAGPFFSVHYKIADDPEAFAGVEPVVPHDQAGRTPTSSPVVVWTPSGGRNGTIVVSANSVDDLFVNRSLGAPDQWTPVRSVVARGYTRLLIPLEHGRVFTVSGGTIGSSVPNSVRTVSIPSPDGRSRPGMPPGRGRTRGPADGPR